MAAADLLNKRAAELHDDVEKFRSDQRKKNRAFAIVVAVLSAVVVGLVTVTIVLALVVVDNRNRADVDRERQAQQQEREAEQLLERQCNAWQDRVEHDAVLVEFLQRSADASGRGGVFVAGLRAEYARSNAEYAAKRGLTEARCR